MTAPMDDDDLLSLVAASLAAEHPPVKAIEEAYEAFGWRNLEAELARMIDDSQVEVVGFGGAAFSRVVTYQSDHGTIELSLDHQTFEAAVIPRPERLIVHQPAQHWALPVDEAGRAWAAGVSGPVRLELAWSTGTALTPWLTL